ncbi:MAG TPA: hypothetical protein VKG79_16885 [Bryobacteraceae bacterium]|nr:hypothetical protein [Bryobacteraceae bacterium]
MTDWWQKREIDRQLAQELHLTQEAFRQANLKLRDLSAGVDAGMSSADSNLALQQAHRACADAFAVWRNALDRWTTFVKDGTIPEDLKTDATKS